jgi:hypothetical protein
MLCGAAAAGAAQLARSREGDGGHRTTRAGSRRSADNRRRSYDNVAVTFTRVRVTIAVTLLVVNPLRGARASGSVMVDASEAVA